MNDNSATGYAGETTDEIEIQELKTYEVAPDGSGIRMSVVGAGGTLVKVIVPTECLRILAMSMPKMVSEALCGGPFDPNIKAVHGVDSWSLERGSDGATAILTVVSKDSFSMSFALTDDDLRMMGDSVSEYEIDAFPFGLKNHH